ncbi:hypothetical protein [Bosea sp. BH3]|uniref:hypothetical protein n=1 Tax=Bosea sp. BH3 TaxID=2871701 RepID=UPI0021CB09A6|nr:hypothetical protein [Bosea sp. BH3]MCU4179677.1 hypothetical protein [Bosea sp. BH3]
MNIRSRETTVTFRSPFELSALDHLQPAGTYRLVIDEEEISAASFVAYRQIATMLHTPALSTPGSSQVFTVNSGELARALEADVEA